jgi:ankyrin repeat protein
MNEASKELIARAWSGKIDEATKRVTELLEHPDIDVNYINENGDTALIAACYNGRIPILDLLLADENINVNLQSEKSCNMTALMKAAENNKEKAVEKLLNFIRVSTDNTIINVSVNLKTLNGNTCYKESTALIIAAQRGYDKIVELLISSDEIDINSINADGDTALILASRNGHSKVVQLLVEDDTIEINKAGKNGQTALHAAAQNGHGNVIEELLNTVGVNRLLNNPETINERKPYMIDVNLINNDGDTALMIATREGSKKDISANYENCIQLLLNDFNIDVSLTNPPENGNTAFMMASEGNNSNIIELFLNCPKMVSDILNKMNRTGETALMIATQNNKPSIVEQLLFTFPKITISNPITENDEIKRMYTIIPNTLKLIDAVQHNRLPDVQRLIKEEIDINLYNPYNLQCSRYALIEASRRGYGSIVTELCSITGINTNVQTYTYGDTALTYSAKYGYSSILQTLINKKANITIQTNLGFTPLMDAVQNSTDQIDEANGINYTETIHQLMHKTTINLSNKNQMTALMLGAQYGKEAAVRQLLGFEGVDVNKQTEFGHTALMYATMYGYMGIVQQLVSKIKTIRDGYGINLQTSYGDTALSYAASAGYADIVGYLLENGANWNTHTRFGMTPLMIASANGHFEVVKKILNFNGVNNSYLELINDNSNNAVALTDNKDIQSLIRTTITNNNARNINSITEANAEQERLEAELAALNTTGGRYIKTLKLRR